MAKGRKTAPARGRSAARGAKKSAAKGVRKGAKKRTTTAATAGRTRAAAKRAKKTPRAAVKRAAKAPAPRRGPVSRTATAKSAAVKKRSTSSRTATERATPAAPRRAPTLDRDRRTVDEQDLLPTPPSSLDLDRSASAARTGRQEYEQRLREHTSTGPALTGGDVDADWEDAESVGDEAPGGDNPTPDQDVVEEIGQALGVTYQDNEELQGGEKIIERDRKRWELDPASREDYNEE